MLKRYKYTNQEEKGGNGMTENYCILLYKTGTMIQYSYRFRKTNQNRLSPWISGESNEEGGITLRTRGVVMRGLEQTLAPGL